MPLTHQWKFNGTLEDSIGNLDFTNLRNLVTFTTGVVQQSLNFQAGSHLPQSSGVFTSSNPFPSTPNAPWSISFWVKNVYEDTFLYLNDNGTLRLSFNFSTSENNFSLYFNNGFYSGRAILKTGTNATTSQFTHYTIVYTNDSIPPKLYINCIEQILFYDGSTPSPQVLDFAQPFGTENISKSSNVFVISNNTSGYQLEDLRIYDEAIGQSEIDNICNSLCGEITQETQLVITTQPTGTYTNVALNTSVVQIRNSSNSLVTSSNLQVTAEIYSGTGNLTGTLSVQAIDGIATFSNLKIDTEGSFTIKYSNPCLTEAISNSISLLEFMPSLNNNINLFIKNNENNNLNLYIDGSGEYVEILPLFIKANLTDDLNLFIFSSPRYAITRRLFIQGALSSSVDLITNGHIKFQKPVFLYLNAKMSNAFDLFLYNSLPFTRELFVRGGFDKDIELFLKQDPQISMPLYIGTDIFPEYSISTNLYMQGEESFRLFYKNLNLFIKNFFGQDTPLYMEAASVAYSNNQMILYTQSFQIVNNINSNINLTLFNNIDGSFSSAPLLTKGLGISDNYLPFDNYMNMFMQRDYESFSEPLNLTIHGNTTFTDYITLFMDADETSTNYVNMSIPITSDVINSTLDLMISGYKNWTDIANALNMYIESANTTTTTTTLAP